MTDVHSPALSRCPERKPSPPAAQARAAPRRKPAAGRRRRPGQADAEGIARPKGAEPTRYGDWENKGIASDF